MKETKMSIPQAEEVDYVHIKRIEDWISSIRRVHPEENIEIGFSYLLMSLFPTLHDNMQKIMTEQYMEGFKAGKEAK